MGSGVSLGSEKGRSRKSGASGSVRESLARLFKLNRAYRQVAALPWRETGEGVEVMLITSRDTGRWVLPKGWPEGDEAFFDAAAREAAEEAGLTGDISEREAGRYVYRKARRSGSDRRCEVLVYPLRVERVADRWPERKQRRREWFSPAEAAARVQEAELAALLSAFPPRDAAA